MEEIIPGSLMNVITSSIIGSVVILAVVQEVKRLPIIHKDWHIWVANLVISFAIGMPLLIKFFEFSISDAAWGALFAFIGAPSLFIALKNINPKSIKEIKER